MVDQARILNEFLELVKVDSISGREAAIRDVLKAKLEALGMEIYEDEAGRSLGSQSGNLMAWMEGDVGPSVFFCAHMDTVEPGLGISPLVEAGAVRSNGNTILGSDDKAGLTAILEALRVIKEGGGPHPPIEVIFTVSEEQGLMGSKHLDVNKIRSKFGYVLDASGSVGNIVIQGPTQNEIAIEVLGKAAHAGMNPEDGLNAIFLAGYAISHLTVGRIDEETTCNLGTIQGGQARNIVPDRVIIKGEARSLNPEKLEQITQNLTGEFIRRVEEKGGQCRVKVAHLYPALRLDPEEQVVQIAVLAAEDMGKKAVLTSSGGGSDANILSGMGIKVANLGIGMKAVHTTDEHILLEDLYDNARFVVKIIEQVGKIKLD
ncbi:MAG: M20/M25/M40 family metallo-hydrolase [Ignavibacteriales bacterium]